MTALGEGPGGGYCLYWMLRINPYWWTYGGVIKEVRELSKDRMVGAMVRIWQPEYGDVWWAWCQQEKVKSQWVFVPFPFEVGDKVVFEPGDEFRTILYQENIKKI